MLLFSLSPQFSIIFIINITMISFPRHYIDRPVSPATGRLGVIDEPGTRQAQHANLITFSVFLLLFLSLSLSVSLLHLSNVALLPLTGQRGERSVQRQVRQSRRQPGIRVRFGQRRRPAGRFRLDAVAVVLHRRGDFIVDRVGPVVAAVIRFVRYGDERL